MHCTHYPSPSLVTDDYGPELNSSPCDESRQTIVNMSFSKFNRGEHGGQSRVGNKPALITFTFLLPFHATCMHIFTSWSAEQCLLPAHTFGTTNTSLATWHYKKSRLDEGECTMQTVVVWHYQSEDVMDKATKLV